MLLDLLTYHKVNMLPATRVEAITDEGVETLNGRRPGVIKADSVVLASGLKPDEALYRSLSGKVTLLYAAGDCTQARNILGAVWDGYEIGRAI
jgi:2-enoate reductase